MAFKREQIHPFPNVDPLISPQSRVKSALNIPDLAWRLWASHQRNIFILRKGRLNSPKAVGAVLIWGPSTTPHVGKRLRPSCLATARRRVPPPPRRRVLFRTLLDCSLDFGSRLFVTIGFAKVAAR